MTSTSYEVATQISEAQRQEKKQSLQSISASEDEEESRTRMLVEEPIQSQRPPREKTLDHRPRLKGWPKAVEKQEWETVNNDLTKILEQQVGTATVKLESMGDIIYHYGVELFGVQQKRSGETTTVQAKSRRQQEIEMLVKE